MEDKKLLELSAKELKGSRLTGETQSLILKAQGDFLIWLEGKGYDLKSAGREELKEYHGVLSRKKSARTGKRLSPSTINTRFTNVCRLFRLSYREGIIESNPAAKLKLTLKKEKGVKRRALTRTEIKKILESFDVASPLGLRDRTLFEVMYSSGLRVSEAAKMRVWDIDFNRREMIVRGKRDKDRIIPFTQTAKKYLVKLLDGRMENKDEWVFKGKQEGSHIQPKTISDRFREVLRNMGMDRKEISAHSIRHSTATHLLESGASIRHVQELLGHKNIQTTERYTHIQIEGLLKIYSKYHPQEHDLYRKVDKEYWNRLREVFGQGK